MFRLAGHRAILLLINLLSLLTVGAQNGAIFSSDIQITMLPDCEGSNLVCLEDIPAKSFSDFTFILDGTPYTGLFSTCKTDTLSIYNYELLYGKGNAGPYRLDSWVVEGITHAGVFQDIPDLVDSMNLWDPKGSWSHKPTSLQIHGGYPGTSYQQMFITVLVNNSTAVIGYNQSFIPLARGVEVNKGIHQLIATNSSAGWKDTLTIIAGCNQVVSQVIQTEVGLQGTTCVDLSGLTGLPGVAESFCPGSYSASQAVLDLSSSCFSWTGSQVGKDTICLITCDEYGFCVEASYIIQVLFPGALNAIDVTVQEGTVASLCPQQGSLPGNLVSLANICPGGMGLHAQLSILPGTSCADLAGVKRGGPEYACLEICTDQGLCDTLTYAIQVTFMDTMEVILDVLIQTDETYCPDISSLPGDTILLTNLCPTGSGLHAETFLDPVTRCVHFKGILPGADSLCLMLEDELGNQVLTYLIINVRNPVATTHQLDLTVGEVIEFCPDLQELAGDLVSAVNDCPGLSAGLLDVVVDPVTGCMVMTGQFNGEGEVCLILCDEWGTCDSFFIQVHVQDSASILPTVATDDEGILSRNQILNLNVLQNDQWSGSDLTVTILPGSGPTLGSAKVEIDNSVTYRPDMDLCGDDQFAYVVCTSTGCDTAWVDIRITCKDVVTLLAYTGFSPNGDGINDYFTFEGLENYPRNTLEVYNRWGNRILRRENYQGNWDGTWGSLIVPDGTYFFILILDSEDHASLSGYVQIQR